MKCFLVITTVILFLFAAEIAPAGPSYGEQYICITTIHCDSNHDDKIFIFKYIKEFFHGDIEPEEVIKNIFVCRVNLNGDDIDDYIYTVLNSEWCGANSCPIGILASSNDGYIDVSPNVSLPPSIPLCIETTNVNGYNNISVGDKGKLHFCGDSYLYSEGE